MFLEMASDVSELSKKESELNPCLKLKGENVPGEERPKPADECTVAILERWLSCRGGKVTGKCNTLSKR